MNLNYQINLNYLLPECCFQISPLTAPLSVADLQEFPDGDFGEVFESVQWYGNWNSLEGRLK